MISKKIDQWLFPPFDDEQKRLQEAAINLFDSLPSRKAVKKAILRGEILVNSEVGNTGTWVKKGDEIQLNFSPIKIGKTDHLEEVVFDDEHMCVVIKKSGISTSGNSKHTLASILHNKLNINTLQHSFNPSHRLDKDTYGLVIFHKNLDVAKKLGHMFEKHEISKKYYAIIHGHTEFQNCTISTPIEGKNSHSKVSTISRQKLPYIGPTSLVELHPTSGRKHQLRIHLKSLGHQIVGDKKYFGDKIFTGHGMFLCCTELKFNHPILKEEVHIKIPLPRKFHKVLSSADLP